MAFARHVMENFSTIGVILNSVAVFLGVTMTFSAIFQLKKYGEQRTMMSSQHSLAGPMMMLVCGAMLLILPEFIDSMLLAFWNNDVPGSYQGDTTGWGSLVPAIEVFMGVVGVGAFIRGIVLMSRVGGQQSQQGTLGKAVVHMFSGLLCIHITGTISLLKNILGLN